VLAAVWVFQAGFNCIVFPPFRLHCDCMNGPVLGKEENGTSLLLVTHIGFDFQLVAVTEERLFLFNFIDRKLWHRTANNMVFRKAEGHRELGSLLLTIECLYHSGIFSRLKEYVPATFSSSESVIVNLHRVFLWDNIHTDVVICLRQKVIVLRTEAYIIQQTFIFFYLLYRTFVYENFQMKVQSDLITT